VCDRWLTVNELVAWSIFKMKLKEVRVANAIKPAINLNMFHPALFPRGNAPLKLPEIMVRRMWVYSAPHFAACIDRI
jgi:hypothetical protein